MEEEDRPARSSPWIIVASVAGVLLFVALVFTFLYRTILSGLFAAPVTTSVPNLEGHLYEEVLSDQELLGRFTLVIGETVEDEAQAGTILNQTPKADSQVGDDVTEITVTISGGISTIKMIDLTDMEYLEAFNALNKAGLEYDTPSYEYDDEVEKDHVISFTPLEGVPVSSGVKVHMVISLGPEVKTIEMPPLVGMTLENAKNQITLMKLVEGEVKEVYSDTVEAGVVVDQYPAAYTTVEEGTTVNLNVSKGPDPATQPKEITKTVTIENVPDTGEIVNVAVMMDGAVVYEDDINTAMELPFVSFKINALDGDNKTLPVFFIGRLNDSFTVTFEE